MAKLFCFDLDGTLANLDHRLPLLNKSFKEFEETCYMDTLNKWVADFLNLCREKGEILILSGRSKQGNVEELTREWLRQNDIFYDYIVMREAGDNTPDHELKPKMLEEFLRDKDYEVQFIVDDRQRVVDAWRAHGYKVLQCNAWEERKKKQQATLIVLIGNIGSGKSTISKKFYEQGFLTVNADSIRTMLGSGNYVFDPKVEDKVIHHVTRTAIEQLMKIEKSLVVDETMMRKKYRKNLLDLAKHYKYKIIGIVMPNAGKEIQAERRMQSESRNYTKQMWEEVWEHIEAKYEEPTKDEGFDLIINMRLER